MTPIASGTNWFTYHVEIPADNLTSLDGNECWVIIQDATADYKNPLNVPNAASTDKLAACFRMPLTVSDIEPAWITVTAPNGGETWQAYSNHDITWTSSTGIADVKVELSLNSGVDYTMVLAGSTPNDGSLTWTSIPLEAVGPAARIRISDVTNESVNDGSDADFTVSLPGITVTSPNGGEYWLAYESHDITWITSAGIVNVKIELSLNSGVDYTQIIAASTPNDSAFTWDSIPPEAASETCRVRVSDVVNAAVSDSSDADFIVHLPTITVTSPNGGEMWRTGESGPITWDADPSIANVKIEASSDSGATWPGVLTDSTPNNGSFDPGPIPVEAVTDHGRIRISDVDNPAIYDETDADYTIYEPWLEVTSPCGGEEWIVGSSHEITWETSEVGGSVNMIYSRDDFVSDFQEITSSTPNNGSFIWDPIPDAISSTVKVGIEINGSSPFIRGSSDDFFSIIPVPPSITVLSPNGGEELRAGHSFDIQWTSVNMAYPVTIYYSKDNFVSDVHLIVDSWANTGVYSWYPIPFDPSTTVSVKVADSDDLAIFDVSDANFTLADNGWADVWGGTNYDGGEDVIADINGNAYATGYIAQPSGYGLAYLKMYNSAGAVVWNKSWGTGGGAAGYGLALDGDSNVYVVGNYSGTIDFDPGTGTDNHTSDANGDVFISKFDSSGNFVWAKTWGGYTDWYNDYGYGVAVNGSDLYITGSFCGTNVDFDPGAGSSLKSSKGGGDAFLAKFGTDGVYTWAVTWGGTDTSSGDEGHGVVVDGFGRVCVAGTFGDSNVDFDPGAGESKKSSAGNKDCFLSWFDQSGSHMGVWTWGGTGYDSADGLAATIDSVYVCGTFAGANLDFDPGVGTDQRTASGTSDAYFSKFDSTNTYAYVRTWGGSANDMARDIDVDPDGNPVICGHFTGTDADFDPGAGYDPRTSNGVYDAYFTMFNLSGDYWDSRTWGGVDYETSYGVSVSNTGRIFITGCVMSSSVQFAPTGSPCGEASDVHSSTGSYDPFMAKYMPDACW
jgi:hypothetical protein